MGLHVFLKLTADQSLVLFDHFTFSLLMFVHASDCFFVLISQHHFLFPFFPCTSMNFWLLCFLPLTSLSSLIFHFTYLPTNIFFLKYTVQLRYIRTMHTRIIRSYFAYMGMSICVYARVCQYARICPFVMHSHKFLYMKHCWSNKGHMGMKRLQSEICILLKRHADQWTMPIFDSCLILSFQIWEENWNSRLKSLS